MSISRGTLLAKARKLALSAVEQRQVKVEILDTDDEVIVIWNTPNQAEGEQTENNKTNCVI